MTQNFSVLLVDDVADMRDLIAAEIEDLGVTIFHASSGDEAFSIYSANKIDFIVSDVNMPNGNGINFVKKVNQHSVFAPPVVLMTGLATISEEEIEKLGVLRLFDGFLDLIEIKKLIQDHLSRSK